ncbi:hypothetical protein [Cerasicoccus arenae]|uniref:Uncharacterized protein n=1 Tax=Cerasicoccus arenae TaxID=424488 RepID=A0A8J3GEU4_9BACT|nr:hypothetical protein [Cerasicoccus arenae]MBK1859211.1 hypothetical protein [Cerasicoccus arenae]GHC01316.1 hypothetical protein GCM10007047_17210 [Cerasicoccus arenae]
MTILPQYEPNEDVSILSYYKRAIREVISDDNESFIWKYCQLIPSVLNRFRVRLKYASDLEIAEHYASLVDELVQCYVDFRSFQDDDTADVCIGLRLQWRLLNEIKHPDRKLTQLC